MVAYVKPWLSLDDQVDRLVARGVRVEDRAHAVEVLRAIGYYRLTGYLYPLREMDPSRDGSSFRVRNHYRSGTMLTHAEELVDFDRRLRLLVMDGVERIEIAMRMQLGYVLGRRSAFAHLDGENFTEAFTAETIDPSSGAPGPSAHESWLGRVDERRARSDERFVAHFREKYDDRMPVWAITELLEMGQLSRLYRGINQRDSLEIAETFGVPTKKLMASWLASLNYVRNVAAHHARLFNRPLQYSPARPKPGQVPLLDHLADTVRTKGGFGAYNALAVIAYLHRSIQPEGGWPRSLVTLLGEFPSSTGMSIASVGVPPEISALDLWRR